MQRLFYFFRRWRSRLIVSLRFGFGLTFREMHGLLVICPLALLWAFLPEISGWILPTPDLTGLPQPEVTLVAPLKPSVTDTILAPVPFDPDTVSAVTLTGFGIPERIAATLIKYRKALGGHFRSPDQLGSVYGMTDSLLEYLRPFIRCREIQKPPIQHNLPVQKAHHVTRTTALDMNLADSSDWETLYGIGPVLSGRIVRYRNLLGGFIRKDQLREVYGMDRSTFDQWERLYIDPAFPIRKLEINESTYQEFRTHPYLSGKQASSIIYYRAQHGPFSRLEELKDIVLMDSSTLVLMNDYFYIRE